MSANRIKFKQLSWPKGPHWLTPCDSFLSLCIRLSSYTSATMRLFPLQVLGACLLSGIASSQQLPWWLFLSTHISSPRSTPPRGIPCPNWQSPTHPQPHRGAPSELMTWWISFRSACAYDAVFPTLRMGLPSISCFYLFPTHNSSRSTDDRDFAELVYTVFWAHSRVTSSS